MDGSTSLLDLLNQQVGDPGASANEPECTGDKGMADQSGHVQRCDGISAEQVVVAGQD